MFNPNPSEVQKVQFDPSHFSRCIPLFGKSQLLPPNLKVFYFGLVGRLFKWSTILHLWPSLSEVPKTSVMAFQVQLYCSKLTNYRFRNIPSTPPTLLMALTYPTYPHNNSHLLPTPSASSKEKDFSFSLLLLFSSHGWWRTPRWRLFLLNPTGQSIPYHPLHHIVCFGANLPVEAPLIPHPPPFWTFKR